MRLPRLRVLALLTVACAGGGHGPVAVSYPGPFPHSVSLDSVVHATRDGALVGAVVDGTAWTSSVASDSLVAFYDASLDRLVIQGQRVQPGQWPGLRITLLGPSGPGRYPLGGVPHAGEWATTNKHRQLALYVTTGVDTDEVILDELDLQAGHVRGSFRITPQLLHGTSRVSIRGQFRGRVSGTP